MKIAIIGAGSIGFTRGIVRDILSAPELTHTSEVALTDIDEVNLGKVHRLIQRDFEANKIRSKLSATTDRRKALRNANYVFCFVRVGGVEGFKTDIEIPLRYGVDQCVGDTLCAGGIMYAQRGIPVLLEFCKDMAEVAAPGCIFINHANPMAMNTWACNQYGHGVKTIGLCHGVEGGWHQIADVLGVPQRDIEIICAGINHQTWYTKVLCRGREVSGGELLKKFEQHPVYSRTEKVRIDMLRRFGCYTTESNGHCSEYLAWYRKNPADMKNWIDLSTWILGETGGYLRCVIEDRIRFKNEFEMLMKGDTLKYSLEARSAEHGAYIIEALETGRLYRGHFNVPNNGIITNLPSDAIVEAPGYVDRLGLHMPCVGNLPWGCAAVCNQSINVQRLAVEAAVHGDDELLRQAMLLDPLTGAVCNPPEVWQMVDELLVAQGEWLPQYKKAVAAAKRRLQGGLKVKVREGYLGAAHIPVENPDIMKREAAARMKLPPPVVRVPAMKHGAAGNPAKVDWSKAASVELDTHPKGYKVIRKAQVRWLHDDRFLYLNILDESDQKSLSNLEPLTGDRWEISVASDRSGPLNVLGIMSTGRLQELVVGGAGEWKSGARVESVVEPHMWRLSVALPLDQLPGKGGKRLLMNIVRGTIPCDLRPLAWSPTFSNELRVAEKLGEVTLA